MIPRKTVEQILDSTRIEDVVSDYVSLKRRGANFVACCPFHNEKTPSFYVSPAKGLFKCFGCGKSGTAVGFLMEQGGMSYTEALKALAKKYNIPVVEEEESAEDIAARQRDESILLVMEWAEKFFHQQLRTPEGAVGLAYFKSRGLEDATIEKFGLGWAPNGRNTLTLAALKAGFKEEYLLAANLCIKTEDGKLIDRFYNRVSFPIRNVSGRTIAFGCRTLSADKNIAKYVNTSETEIYQKRFTLYGMDAAKVEARRQDKFILVEGYLDVITMHQLGITNVAASSGTSLTVEQVKLIKRFTDNVTIIYDGDSAGIHAALRGIGLVLSGGLNVKIVLLPDGDDPDSFGRKHTKDEVLDFISSNEQDFIAFKSAFLLGEAGNDPLKRASLVNEIGDTIALITDPIKRSMYIPFAAAKLDVDEELLRGRVQKALNDIREQWYKDREREKRLKEAADTSVADRDYGPGQEQDSENTNQNLEYTAIPASNKDKYLEPCERELLSFILNDGKTPVEFAPGSEFYIDGQVHNVFEIIYSSLYEDNISFSDPGYKAVFDSYMELYVQDLTQEQISVRLLNHENPLVAKTAHGILEEQYRITVKKFADSLTNPNTLLASRLPRSILVYDKAIVEKKIETLSRQLKGASTEESLKILQDIKQLDKTKVKLSNKLNRI